jgi:hypothetical protein
MRMTRFLLLIIGIVLIWFGFFTLVEVHPWTNQTWLDFFVVIAVFVFNFLNITFIGQSKSDFRFRIASRGILWTSCGLYSILSIGALITAHTMNWSFSFSMFFQLVMAFGVLIALSTASLADRNAQNVQKGESIAMSSLDQLRDTFNNGVGPTARITSSHPEIKKTIDKIGEDIRYFSALSGIEARQLDTEIESEIHVLFSSLGRAKADDLGPQKTDIEDSLDRITELIRKRKNCRDNSDHKEMFS